ncbi:hypothetical protein Dimus_036883 [Dionaea muscipula]
MGQLSFCHGISTSLRAIPDIHHLPHASHHRRTATLRRRRNGASRLRPRKLQPSILKNAGDSGFLAQQYRRHRREERDGSIELTAKSEKSSAYGVVTDAIDPMNYPPPDLGKTKPSETGSSGGECEDQVTEVPTGSEEQSETESPESTPP